MRKTKKTITKKTKTVTKEESDDDEKAEAMVNAR